MDHKGIMLSVINQKHKPYDFFFFNVKSETKQNKTKPKLTDTENRLMVIRGKG